MPTQTYFCPLHNEIFYLRVPFSRKHPPKTAFCPLESRRDGKDQVAFAGGHTGSWRPSAVNFIVKEGTGAFKRSPINHD